MEKASTTAQHTVNNRAKRRVVIYEALMVATVLCAFIIMVTFTITPGTVTIKTLLSAATVTLLYPATITVAMHPKNPSQTQKTSGRTKH